MPSVPGGTSIPPVTIARPYSMADVALRFLNLLPDLGVIAVVGVLAHAGKIESTISLVTLLAVLAGRLNPSALKMGGAMHGASIVPFVAGFGALAKKAGLFSVLVFVISGCSGCATLKADAPGIGKIAVCVIEHDTETPEQIARDCGGVAVTEVIAILSAARAQEIKHVAAKARTQAPQDAGKE